MLRRDGLVMGAPLGRRSVRWFRSCPAWWTVSSHAAFFPYSRFFFSSMNLFSNSIGLT